MGGAAKGIPKKPLIGRPFVDLKNLPIILPSSMRTLKLFDVKPWLNWHKINEIENARMNFISCCLKVTITTEFLKFLFSAYTTLSCVLSLK